MNIITTLVSLLVAFVSVAQTSNENSIEVKQTTCSQLSLEFWLTYGLPQHKLNNFTMNTREYSPIVTHWIHERCRPP